MLCNNINLYYYAVNTSSLFFFNSDELLFNKPLFWLDMTKFFVEKEDELYDCTLVPLDLCEPNYLLDSQMLNANNAIATYRV